MAESPATVTVAPYSPEWPRRFEDVRARLAAALAGLDAAIEHVGSTSVPGLDAKPIVDIDVALARAEDFPAVKARLEALGYAHRRDLSIPEREPFREPPDAPRHNLYVCPPDSLALDNHLRVRDWLRAHPDDAAAYAELKRGLARAHPRDVDAYCAGKSDFLAGVLRRSGLAEEQVRAIQAANALPPGPKVHRTLHRVAYADTDRMGRVYYANYFVYAERARTELLRDVGFPYRAFEEGGLFFPVRKASARYAAPAFYDDELALLTTVAQQGHARLTCVTRIVRPPEDTLLATATVELACVNADGKPTPIPAGLRDALKPYLDPDGAGL